MEPATENPYRAPQHPHEAAADTAHHALLSPPIQTSRVLQTSDIWPLTLLYHGGWKQTAFGFPGIFLVFLLLAIFGNDNLWIVYVIAMGAAVLLFMFVLIGMRTTLRTLKKHAREATGAFAPQTLQFSADGVELRSESENAKIPWPRFSVASITKNHAILRFANLLGYFPLARHMLDSDADWQRLTDFFKAELKPGRKHDLTTDNPDAARLPASPRHATTAAREDDGNSWGSPIQISGSANWQEYREVITAIRVRWRDRAEEWAAYALPALACVVGWFYYSLNGGPIALIASTLLGVVTFMLWGLRWVLWRAVRRELRNHTGFFAPLEREIHANRLITRTNDAYLDQNWDQFETLRMIPSGCLLKLKIAYYWIYFPRRMFANESDWQRVLALFTTRFAAESTVTSFNRDA